VEKYAGKPFTVVAVNVSSSQDDRVLPFLRENRYSFTPVRVNMDIARAYEVGGVPSEFVIDKNGRLVAEIRLNSDRRQRAFETLLDTLLR